MMILVTIYSLSFPPSPMFVRAFQREIDALDYMAMWRHLGACHIRRVFK